MFKRGSFLLFALLAISACKIHPGSGDAAPTPSPPSAAATRGSLELKVSFVGNYTSLVITVTDAANEVVATRTVRDFASFFGSPLSIDVPIGFLKVKADVFVAAMGTDVPVKSGTASGISVSGAATVAVSIDCLPVSPIMMPENGITDTLRFSAINSTNDSTHAVDGTEHWIAARPTSSGITLKMNVVSGEVGGTSVSVIDSSGKRVSAYDYFLTDGIAKDFAVVPDAMNFFCLSRGSPVDATLQLAHFDATRATGLSLDFHSYALNLGDTADIDTYFQLKPRFTPTTAFNKAVRVSSSNPGAVAANDAGLLIGLGLGDSSTITVTSIDGGFSDSCVVTVVNPPPHAAWNTVDLAGGASAVAAANASPIEQWYRSSFAATGTQWYRLSVTAGRAYDFYNDIGEWENSSRVYTGYPSIQVFRADGSTAYDRAKYSAYKQPVTMVAAEDTMLVCFKAAYASDVGTYAFGVHPQ